MSPAPISAQAGPPRLPRIMSRQLLRIAKERLQRLSGQQVPAAHHLHSTAVLPDVQMDPLVLRFVPIAYCPGTGHHRKQHVPKLFAPSLQAFMCIDEISPDPPPGWQSQLSQALLVREGGESLEEREESEFKSMKILILIRIEYISRKIKLWENPSTHLAASLEA